MEPKPFKNVRYFLPYGKETPSSGKPKWYALPNAFVSYAYSHDDAKDRPDLLFSNIPAPSDTIDSLIGELMSGLASSSNKRARVEDWDSLLECEPLAKDGQSQTVGDVRASSVGKFRRQVRRIAKTRQSGLLICQRTR